MFSSDKNIYLQETEIKPNRYAVYAMSFALGGTVFCWILNEIGMFRVGTREMRIGSSLSTIAVLIPLIMLLVKPKFASKPYMKYVVIASASLLTLSTTTLLTFHTTIMLLFPIFIGMLYRSNHLGKIALLSSMLCTIVSPILGYLLGTWDIELFKELILIGTNGTAVIEGAYPAITMVSVNKILLYIVLPRMIMVGSCALLMFYIISIGVDHVNNQILIFNLSQRDALTGLYNRNYLNDVLRDPSFAGNCAVLFFDVNGLKQVNDRLGHEAGDLLLRKCAECLKSLCDENKSGAFRMGGDEFIILFFEVNERDVLAMLSQLDERLKNANETAELQRSDIRCSMASGYAIGDFTDSDNLIRTADTNMYINKKAMKSIA